jgi:hypothetical protein
VVTNSSARVDIHVVRIELGGFVLFVEHFLRCRQLDKQPYIRRDATGTPFAVIRRKAKRRIER